MKYILLILLFSASNVFATQDYDPAARTNPNRHACSYAIDDQVYSPARYYNNHLRYLIESNIGQVAVFNGGRHYLVDTATEIRHAFDMWRRRLAQRGIPITLTEVPQGPPAEVNFWFSRAETDPAYNQQGFLRQHNIHALTTLILPDQIMNRYVYPLFNISGIVVSDQMYFSDEEFNIFRDALPSGIGDQQIANMLVYYVMSHEIGHALGLHHPNENMRDFEWSHQDPIDLEAGHFYGESITALVPRGAPDARTPLMGADDGYFGRLHDQLGRRLNYDDIGPSELELNAIATENACGGLHSSQSKINVALSESCKEKPRVFYPIAQSLVPIYQTQLFN
ncbi:hypothetical protein Xsto_02236 [Xenorhabdus stockiae]|uniref:Peptidase M10 metallopeptidase domain-containing protein n=1 Tax=Xenorhabdus stockiae TaxID=351614 RepID=A0A2D0KP86_9GAMM|nr:MULTISPECIES: hypothetical protein [Xenorhabdus]PHM65254.1 hypothetical protein Xsto_02236 [Xenorhabdus stockiae]PHM66731.1 hypothetical protein Xekj_04041 [Xenorhabdus sp. KJ12.1]